MTLNGLYLSTPGVTIFPGSHQAVRAARERLIVTARDGSFEHLSPGYLDFQSLEPLAPLLTRQHELNHYAQLTSTYFGLLLWQIDLALHDMIYPSPRNDRVASRPRPGDKNEALSDLVAFSTAVGSNANLTMQEFLVVANRMERHVSAYWGMEPRQWVARNARRDSYLPRGGLTSVEIVEAQARLAELRFLQSGGRSIPGPLLQEWEATKMHGPYRRATELLARQIGSVDVSIHLCDESLMGLSCLAVPLSQDAIIVEDVLPSWRLMSMLGPARDHTFSASPPDYGSAIQGFMPRPNMGSLTINDLDPMMILGPDRTPHLADQTYRFWVLNRYVQGLKLRSEGVKPHILTTPDEARRILDIDGFQPLAEFYEDNVLYNTAAIKDVDLLLQCYVEVIYDVLSGAILSGSKDLKMLGALEAGVRRLLGDDIFDSLSVSVPDVVSHFIDADASENFLM